MKILAAQKADAETLANLFLSHIDAHREYISHGEIQMGVGVGRMVNNLLEAEPSPEAREKWIKYIEAMLADNSVAAVWKAVEGDEMVGMAVADIEDAGDAPFGMVCDVLVKEDYRGHGTGGTLLQTAIDWLRSKGVKDIYLESGKNNHAAHKFFEKRGFAHVSEIYKLG
ncbi:MAG: GNAT family N-acetyltransferase [Bacteroidales bacterium]|nr:GNAT family N-acetyltransferase [Bacteroidales bacterium]